MEITPEERRFLRDYNKLSEHDKGYVDALIESLEKSHRKKNFKLYERKEKKK